MRPRGRSWAVLASLRDAGAILIVTTHDLDVIDGVLDQAVFLRDGRVSGIEQGGVTGLRRSLPRASDRGAPGA